MAVANQQRRSGDDPLRATGTNGGGDGDEQGGRTAAVAGERRRADVIWVLDSGDGIDILGIVGKR